MRTMEVKYVRKKRTENEIDGEAGKKEKGPTIQRPKKIPPSHKDTHNRQTVQDAILKKKRGLNY